MIYLMNIYLNMNYILQYKWKGWTTESDFKDYII